MFSKLTPFAKILLAVVFVGLVVGTLVFINKSKSLKDAIIPEKNKVEALKEGPNGEPLIKVSVNTWGGFAGGWLYNEGFASNDKSRFLKEQGILVDFKLQDDFNASRESWKSGEVDLLWSTIDCFAIESEALKDFEPVVLFQVDWSRGGDAIVVRRGINNVNDLRGKTIALAPMTPSNTFLVWLLESSNLTYSDVNIVEVANAIDAAQMFKDGKVDACVCWSPDDQDCVAQVPGSKVLQSTKEASNIIADVFFAKKSWVEKNKDIVQKFIKGWMIGSAEVNTSGTAKDKAVKIMSEGTNQPVDFCLTAINNAKITTVGDNLNFFNVNGNFNGVTGEQVYAKMTQAYKNLGYIKNNSLPWKQVIYPSLVKNLDLKGKQYDAETAPQFSPVTDEIKHKDAISTKSLTINFATNSYTLDDNAKYIIDNQFLPIAKGFRDNRIRIQGNTDNTGNRKFNIDLSYKRAQSVADYLVERGFDRNRFIIIGNGPDNPVGDNSTETGKAKNRRTDFELL